MHQVCTDFVPANATIISTHGTLQYLIETRFDTLHSCREAAIAHCQGWKRVFYAFNTRPPPIDAHAMVLSENGAIPIKLPLSKLPTYGQLMDVSRYYDSQAVVRHADIISLRLSLMNSRRASSNKYRQVSIPHQINRLISISGKGSHKPSSTSSIFATSYCLRFTDDLKKCSCHVMGDSIRILQIDDSLSSENGDDVDLNEAITLISVGWLGDFFIHRFDQLLNSWDGLKLLVLAHTESINSFVSHRSDVTVIIVHISSCMPLHKDSTINQQQQQKTEEVPPPLLFLPDNTLINIGLDASPTTLVCITPHNAVFRSEPKQQQQDPDHSHGHNNNSGGDRGGRFTTRSLLSAMHTIQARIDEDMKQQQQQQQSDAGIASSPISFTDPSPALLIPMYQKEFPPVEGDGIQQVSPQRYEHRIYAERGAPHLEWLTPPWSHPLLDSHHSVQIRYSKHVRDIYNE